MALFNNKILKDVNMQPIGLGNTKVDEAIFVSFLNETPIFLFLNDGVVVLIQWVSNT